MFCGALGMYCIPQVIQWAGQQFVQSFPQYAVIGQGVYFFGYILAFFLLFQLRQKLTRCGTRPRTHTASPPPMGDGKRHHNHAYQTAHAPAAVMCRTQRNLGWALDLGWSSCFLSLKYFSASPGDICLCHPFPVTTRSSFGITEDPCAACAVVRAGVICASVRV